MAMLQITLETNGLRTDVLIVALEAWHIISTRTRNCLGQLDRKEDPTSTVAGVRIEEMRLSDLSRCERISIFRLPNLGRVSYCEIAAAMDRYGWRFHDRWFSKREPAAIELLGSSLPRDLQRSAQSAQIRSERFALGQEMLRLHEGEKLTSTEIGRRYNLTGAAVHAMIQKTRRTLELRRLFPLPPAVAN